MSEFGTQFPSKSIRDIIEFYYMWKVTTPYMDCRLHTYKARHSVRVQQGRALLGAGPLPAPEARAAEEVRPQF